LDYRGLFPARTVMGLLLFATESRPGSGAQQGSCKMGIRELLSRE